MHYLWLFHSRNGLVCTHANERTVWRDRQGGEGKRVETDLIAQIKAMENTHAWGLSLSSRRQCCWNGRVLLSAESMKCLQHADRPWFHPTSDSNDSNMTDYNPHPSASRLRFVLISSSRKESRLWQCTNCFQICKCVTMYLGKWLFVTYKIVTRL